MSYPQKVSQRVRIGNILVESRELSWEAIKDLAQELKRFARWDSEKKEWRITWRLLSRIDDFFRFINTKAYKYDEEYASKLSDVVEELLNSIPKIIVDEKEDKLYIAAIGFDPYLMLRRIEKETLPITLVKREIEIPQIGKIEAMYLAMSLNRIQNIVEKGLIGMIPEPLRDAILRVEYLQRPIRVKVRVSQGNRIVVELHKNLSQVIEKIKELATIKFYVQGETGFEEKIIQSYKIYTSGDLIRIYLPAFVAGFLEDIFSSFGLEADIDYGLPQKILENLEKKFTLYPHQREALTKWISNNYKGTIVIPTGGGKTIVGIAAIIRTRRPTLILVPNLWLLEQWRERLSQFAGVPQFQVGTLGGGEKVIKDITVATYQSAVKNIDKIKDKFWLVIYDESHHIPARTFRRVAMNLRAPYKMALSATPKRSDKNEILIFKLAGSIVYETTYSQLVRMGLVAPMVFRRIYVPMPTNLKLQYYQLERMADRAGNDLEKKRIINQMIHLAQENPVKLEVIQKIVEKHKNDKIFVFAPTIKFAKVIARELNRIVPTEALTAEASKSREKLIIQRFKSCTIQALVIIKKAEEGVDIGEANVAIIVGGSKQEREFIQRVGRVLRAGSGKIAWVYEIVSEDTVEEAMARKRGGLRLVSSIADFVRKKFGIEAIKEIFWSVDKSI